MNIRAVFYYIGHVLRIEAVLLVPAALISLFRQETASMWAFVATIFILIAVGQGLVMLRPADRRIFAREGLVTVALSWVLLSVFGALPFVISGEIPHYVNALFETVSGFTTTGATILTNVERLSMGMLYWRSFTHWVGGMGVLVFVLAIMPLSSGSGGNVHLLRAESPGPVVGKLVPRLRHTARILYTIYVALTVIEIVFLVAGGMPFFDSLLHAFGTAGTGGFSLKNASLAAYSPYLQTVVAVFMMLFGVNFSVYYLLLVRDFTSIRKNEEIKWYFGIIIAATAIITLNILPLYQNFGEALHHAFFQTSSIMTTTGYVTADFALWPELSRMLLLLLMIIGASAGSTGGGIKVVRLVILFKSIKGAMQKLLHPNSVQVAKLDGKALDGQVTRSVHAFMVLYFLVCGISILLVALDNLPTDATISSVLACLNNIGPGLGVVGATGNFSTLSILSKITLIFDMLIGRLEIFPIIMLFNPSVWKRGK